MLTDDARNFLLRAEEEIEYTCGVPFLPNNDNFLKHIVYIEQKVNSCSKAISHQYYGARKYIENFKLIFFHCLDEGIMAKDDNFIRQFKSFKARCKKCKEKGIISYQAERASLHQVQREGGKKGKSSTKTNTIHNSEYTYLTEESGGEERVNESINNDSQEADAENNKKRKRKHQSADSTLEF